MELGSCYALLSSAKKNDILHLRRSASFNSLALTLHFSTGHTHPSLRLTNWKQKAYAGHST